MALNDALMLYRDSGIYPFHMPGHKRNTFIADFAADFGLDITEVDGFDDLHDAKGILRDAMRRAAALYGSDRAFFLVNGSTGGILAGISACVKQGDKVLVARNSHKAVYNALYLNRIRPIYIYPPELPEYGIAGSITTESVAEALRKNNDIKLVIITSPTYEGVVSDITAIAEITHNYNIPLLVDEAHGAHFGFHPAFPKRAIECGADIVIQSLHKTLPAPTQSALLHVCGKLVDYNEVERQLAVFQTSSPSYIFMAGIDSCIELLYRQKEQLFRDYYERLNAFFVKMRSLRNISIFRAEDSSAVFYFDIGKIVISVKNTSFNGSQLKRMLLDKYLLQLEMAMGDYALAMTSICDTDEGFERLGNALIQTDEAVVKVDSSLKIININSVPEIVMSAWETESCSTLSIPINESLGAVSAEYAYAYPPGVPLLVPGERINAQTLEAIELFAEQGVNVRSSCGNIPQRINVIDG